MAKPNTVKRLTPVAAVDWLEELYAKAASALAEALDAYLSTGAPPSPETRAKFHYPFLRLIYRNEKLHRSQSLRAFARLHRQGVYETTATHPAVFRSYLLEQLEPGVGGSPGWCRLGLDGLRLFRHRIDLTFLTRDRTN